MARSKRASTEDATPTAEAIAEATSDVPPPSSEMTDQQILEYIQSQQVQNGNAAPPAPRKTVSDLYNEMIALVASASGRRIARVSENTAVKVLEITLGWHLQTRNSPQPDIFPQEVYGDGGNGSEENTGPVPHETIDAAPDADAAPESE